MTSRYRVVVIHQGESENGPRRTAITKFGGETVAHRPTLRISYFLTFLVKISSPRWDFTKSARIRYITRAATYNSLNCALLSLPRTSSPHRLFGVGQKRRTALPAIFTRVHNAPSKCMQITNFKATKAAACARARH